jgi:hypothetical protein
VTASPLEDCSRVSDDKHKRFVRGDGVEVVRGGNGVSLPDLAIGRAEKRPGIAHDEAFAEGDPHR